MRGNGGRAATPHGPGFIESTTGFKSFSGPHSCRRTLQYPGCVGTRHFRQRMLCRNERRGAGNRGWNGAVFHAARPIRPEEESTVIRALLRGKGPYPRAALIGSVMGIALGGRAGQRFLEPGTGFDWTRSWRLEENRRKCVENLVTGGRPPNPGESPQRARDFRQPLGVSACRRALPDGDPVRGGVGRMEAIHHQKSPQHTQQEESVCQLFGWTVVHQLIRRALST